MGNQKKMFSPFTDTNTYHIPESISGRSVKTKCMCTIGPTSGSKVILAQLLKAGMNVARFNVCHRTMSEWQEAFDNLKVACSETGLYCATVLDMKGPEIRIGSFKDGGVQIKEGQQFTFRTNFVEGDNTQVSIKSWTLWKHLNPGDKLVVDYGAVSFVVESISNLTIKCRALNSNFIGNDKIVILDQQKEHGDKQFRCQLLSYRDTEDIAFGVRNKFDFIAAPLCDISAVAREAEDPQEYMVAALKEAVNSVMALPGVRANKTKLLFKLKTAHDIFFLDQVLEACHGVILSRSQLTLSIPIEQVAPLQKRVAARCNALMKPLVVMNHVLGSMVKQPQPSRSEATDVANLVLDGVHCLCITAPVACGTRPVQVVDMLRRICRETELDLNYRSHYITQRNAQIQRQSLTKAARAAHLRVDSLASGAAKLAWDLEASAIIIFSDTGKTVQRVALYRPHCQLIAITSDERVARQLQLTFGTWPIVVGSVQDADAITDHVVSVLRPKKVLVSGDYLVRISGVLAEKGATSDHLSVFQVP